MNTCVRIYFIIIHIGRKNLWNKTLLCTRLIYIYAYTNSCVWTTELELRRHLWATNKTDCCDHQKFLVADRKGTPRHLFFPDMTMDMSLWKHKQSGKTIINNKTKQTNKRKSSTLYSLKFSFSSLISNGSWLSPRSVKGPVKRPLKNDSKEEIHWILCASSFTPSLCISGHSCYLQ